MSSKRSQLGKYLGEYNNDFLIELGQVIVAFQELESEIRNLCCYLINKDDYKLGKVIIFQMKFVQLCLLLKELLKYRKLIESKKNLDLMIKDMQSINDFRNELIHSVYIPSSDKNKMIMSKYKRKSQNDEYGLITVEAISLFVDEIDSMIHRFDIFSEQVKAKII